MCSIASAGRVNTCRRGYCTDPEKSTQYTHQNAFHTAKMVVRNNKSIFLFCADYLWCLYLSFPHIDRERTSSQTGIFPHESEKRGMSHPLSDFGISW